MEKSASDSKTRQFEFRIAALEEMLATLERTTLEQSERIERSHEAEAHLAAIVQSSDDAILSISTDYRVISWNKGAERLFGWKAEEAIGQLMNDLEVTPVTRTSEDRQMRQVFVALGQRPDFVRRFETEMQRKDGSRVEVSLVACGLVDSSGKALGMAVILRDITERKRSEQDQALLAAIVNGSEDAIVGTSLEGDIISWNRGAEKLFDITAQAAVGRKIVEFVGPEDHQRVAAAIAELSRTGKSVSFRLRSIRKNGTPFESWVNLFPTYDSRGKIVAVGSIGRDITDQVRMQDAQASLATIVNASHDAII